MGVAVAVFCKAAVHCYRAACDVWAVYLVFMAQCDVSGIGFVFVLVVGASAVFCENVMLRGAVFDVYGPVLCIYAFLGYFYFSFDERLEPLELCDLFIDQAVMFSEQLEERSRIFSCEIFFDICQRYVEFFEHGYRYVCVELQYGIISVAVRCDYFGSQYAYLVIVEKRLFFYPAEFCEFTGREISCGYFSASAQFHHSLYLI